MYQRRYLLITTIAGLLFSCTSVADVIFEPGVGLGLEYTDNARLSPAATEEDLITVGYVGARVTENEGPLKYNADVSFSKNNYVRDTFEDQRYFNLAGRADWDMIKDRFKWFLSNRFSQLPILSNNGNTPTNIQDSNAFTFGANIQLLKSARQSFSLVPTYNQYYFEVLKTDSRQYSLAASWKYQMTRLTNMGFNLSARKINYTETDLLGRSIEDTTFTSLGLTFNGQRARSTFSGSLGTTNVQRDNGDETTGFSGFLKWLADVSSRSKVETLLSTDLTDAGSVAFSDGGADVQVTTDVIRNAIASLAYLRDDASLHTRISARYHKLTYSESPLDRNIISFGVNANYPVTSLLSSGAYMTYSRTDQVDQERVDKNYTVGGNIKYRFSRKLQGFVDLKYRTKESTRALQNYDDTSIFVSLKYGFGGVRRPSRVAGF